MTTCFFCHREISPDELHHHHLVPRVDGGDPAGETVPCHSQCHNDWHREQGHYAAWTRARYTERVRMFGAAEVHRLLAAWGRKGYRVATAGDKRAWHRAGGLARVANGRDERGRLVPTAKE